MNEALMLIRTVPSESLQRLHGLARRSGDAVAAGLIDAELTRRGLRSQA